jgi:hypothetical protein
VRLRCNTAAGFFPPCPTSDSALATTERAANKVQSRYIISIHHPCSLGPRRGKNMLQRCGATLICSIVAFRAVAAGQIYRTRQIQDATAAHHAAEASMLAVLGVGLQYLPLQ